MTRDGNGSSDIAMTTSAKIASFSAILVYSLVLSGCWVGEEIAFSRPTPGHPNIPKDISLLRKDLDHKPPPPDIVGETGTVWRMDMTNPRDGERRVHWLILYPDGKCLTSLREERWRGTFETWLDEIADEESIRVRNAWMLDTKRAESARRIEILNSGNTGRLRAEYESERDLFVAPKLGRFSATGDTIRINLFELNPMQGVGLVNYDTAAVSRITFVKQGDCWKISVDETKTIWWSPYDLTGKLFRQDHATVYSTRGIDVTLRKVDGFKPAALPEDWNW